MSFSRNRLTAGIKAALCTAWCVVALFGNSAFAQPPAEPAAPGKFEVLPVIDWLSEDYFKNDKRDKTKDKELREKVSKIRNTIAAVQKDERGDAIKDEANAKIYDTYYSQFILAQMTQPERATLYAADRQNFFKLHMVPIKSADVHDRLVNMTMTTMLDVARKNFHPAARYNAMLIVGELNSREAVKTGAASPPEPHLPALAAMLKEFNSPTQTDPVRVACLVGILRHAEMDGQKQDLQQRWQPKIKLAVIDPMLTLLNEKMPPAGRSVEGQLWMQRRALDVLGALGDPGTDATVAKKMEQLIADENTPMSLRCSAAQALGRLTGLAPAKFDTTDAARYLGELAAAAGRNELDRLGAEKKHRDDYLKSAAPGGTGYGGPRGVGPGGPGVGRPGGSGVRQPSPYGGGEGGPRPGAGAGGFEEHNPLQEELEYREKYKLEVSCKRLKYELACARAGLEGTITRLNTGIKAQSSNPALKNFIEQELTKKIDELAKVVETSDPKLELLMASIGKKVTELEDAVAKAPAGAAKVVPEPATDPAAAEGPGVPPPAKTPAVPPAVPPPAAKP